MQLKFFEWVMMFSVLAGTAKVVIKKPNLPAHPIDF